MAKSYNFNFRKNDVTWPLCANGLFSIFDDLGGWQPWMKWVHIAPIKDFNLLTIHVCSQRKKRQNFWCKKKQVFTALQKIIANLTNRYCPRPRGKMQCYKSVIPWLCPGYSLAMSRDLGAVVSIDWCIWLLDTAIPRKWAFLQIALQCIANPLRMLCMSV